MTAEADLTLFADHLAHKRRGHEPALNACGFEALLLASGSREYRFKDDQFYPFKSASFFAEWLPAVGRPDHYLLIRTGSDRPKVLFPTGEDLWHTDPLPIPEPIAREFDWSGYANGDELSRQLKGMHLAYIGAENCVPAGVTVTVNPDELMRRLDWHRACKSHWEVDCLRQANRIAARGHSAVREAFLAGGVSEYDLHMIFLQAVRAQEWEQPYDNIVALNEHASRLHHFLLDKTAPKCHRSCLVDAGATVFGYGADVTRTWCADASLFADLVVAMDRMQQQIIESIRPGIPYVELSRQSQRALAGLLHDAGVTRLSADALLESGLVKSFYPHALGHLLGIQVHDRGWQILGPDGREASGPAGAARMQRPIEAGHVFTIEPGLYFIPRALERLREHPHADAINWRLVESLVPYGGIRVEDDIWVSANGPENLTRHFLN